MAEQETFEDEGKADNERGKRNRNDAGVAGVLAEPGRGMNDGRLEQTRNRRGAQSMSPSSRDG